MSKRITILSVNSFAHFLVDAMCLAALAAVTAEDRAFMVLTYNTLAFSTQCLTGLIIDRTGHEPELTAAAMFLVAIGSLFHGAGWIMVCVIGLGNSLFHVAAGTQVMKQSEGKASDLGVFVAPGAFGVTVGTLWPQVRMLLAAALIVLAFFVLYINRKGIRNSEDPAEREQKPVRSLGIPVSAVLLLTAAVAVRAVGGAAVTFPWKAGVAAALLMTAAVFTGKFLGGFLCDRVGGKKAAWLTIPAAAILIAFCSAYMIPSLAGQLLLNLTMPLTLYLMYRLMPEDPGLAFGLAASALWPGTIIGSLFKLTGPALGVCVIISFVFGLYAVIFCIKVIENRKGNLR